MNFNLDTFSQAPLRWSSMDTWRNPFGLPCAFRPIVGVLDGQHYSGFGRSNILKLFALATDAQIESGLSWYDKAHDLAVRIGNDYGYSVAEIAKLIAVLSPNLAWEKNIEAAIALAWAGAMGGTEISPAPMAYMANVRKAFQLLQGIDNLSGPKVLAFADNVSFPQTSEEVTIDSHILTAYCEMVFREYTVEPSRFPQIADDIRSVADYVGLRPPQLQAVVWNVTRETLRGNAPVDDIDLESLSAHAHSHYTVS